MLSSIYPQHRWKMESLIRVSLSDDYQRKTICSGSNVNKNGSLG